jgi:hypothetical protein
MIDHVEFGPTDSGTQLGGHEEVKVPNGDSNHRIRRQVVHPDGQDGDAYNESFDGRISEEDMMGYPLPDKLAEAFTPLAKRGTK